VVVARVRIIVDLPAPLGPRSPSTPGDRLYKTRNAQRLHARAIRFAWNYNDELHSVPFHGGGRLPGVEQNGSKEVPRNPANRVLRHLDRSFKMVRRIPRK
jgi:hypothetical protein